ncbi:hypothetical protein K3495_g8014 [Podosphaera aphanis]|nr:hypothetical protein K3495_g8014 [Podosphaera aphanis]
MTDTDSGTRNDMIDETPISPSRARQNSLEKHLQQRPNAQELKERHILLDIKAAPALQVAAHELERQLATDNLKKGLEKRPHREDLIERNILPDSSAAPALQGQQRELEKNMRADFLRDKIANRPQSEVLVKKGILTEAEADRLYEERIEEEYAKREGGA